MIFEEYPVTSWKVGDAELKFPISSVRESGGNRIIERERPYRDGAKLDDTGSKAKRWIVTVCFENTIEETGLDPSVPLYPDVLNQLIQSFDTHQTGDLVIPTIGKQRARAESYERTETNELRDAAEATFTWVEDNEDSVDFRSISAPTVSANARRLAEQTVFDAESVQVADDSLDNVKNSLDGLDDAQNSPSSLSYEINDEIGILSDNAKKAKQIFSQAGRDGRDTLSNQRGNRAERQIVKSQDLSGRARNEAREGRPEIIRVTVGVDTSLMVIAAQLSQSFDDLLAINDLPNPNFIPAGSVVKVFAIVGAVQQQGTPAN